jgi:hypothetical protein
MRAAYVIRISQLELCLVLWRCLILSGKPASSEALLSIVAPGSRAISPLNRFPPIPQMQLSRRIRRGGG